MGISRLDDLIAWQLANAFKRCVYALLRDHAAARADLRYCDQLRSAAASVGMNIGEGFHRFGAREFSRYLSMALASLEEARLWILDGVDREHFDASACAEVFTLAKRCRIATLRLRQSLEPFSGGSKGR